jgi:hypothetical protein
MLLRSLPLRASFLRRGLARGRDGKWNAGVETMDALAQQMENAGMGAAGGADGSASFEPAQAQTRHLSSSSGTLVGMEAGGLARVAGLRAAEKGGVVEFSDGSEGLVIDLEDDSVVVATLSNSAFSLSPGTDVELKANEWTCPVGPGLQGRVVDAMGHPIDDLGDLTDVKWLPSHQV